MAAAAPEGLGAVVSALTQPVTLPKAVTRGDSFFCSEVVTAAFGRAKVPMPVPDGAAPGDLTRLVDSGTLDALGRLPIDALAAA